MRNASAFRYPLTPSLSRGEREKEEEAALLGRA